MINIFAIGTVRYDNGNVMYEFEISLRSEPVDHDNNTSTMLVRYNNAKFFSPDGGLLYEGEMKDRNPSNYTGDYNYYYYYYYYCYCYDYY